MKFIRSVTLGLATALVFAPVDLTAQAQGPKGWVGVLITTGIGEQNASGRMVFHDYPVIESIDPGSPAEKAGLQAGDVLISINAQDFKLYPIPMNDLLVPGRNIVFRYRRDNVERITKLLVEQRPAGTSAVTELRIIGPDTRRVAIRRDQEAAVARKVTTTRVSVPPMIRIAPITFGTGTPSIAIAGAELTQLNEGLRQYVKVKGDGVFVVNVMMGTPAEEAGLKGGDVILKAASEPLQSPVQLIRLIEDARSNSLALLVLRKNKRQNLTLRW